MLSGLLYLRYLMLSWDTRRQHRQGIPGLAQQIDTVFAGEGGLGRNFNWDRASVLKCVQGKTDSLAFVWDDVCSEKQLLCST